MPVSLDRWKGKVAVVTGASAGIGAAVAELLVDAGLKVVGIARRKDKLEDLAKRLGEGKEEEGKLHPFVGDVSREEDVLSAFEWTRENVGPVSILINSAGISRLTNLVEGDAKFWREVLDTNVLGLCLATREAVKDMRANNTDGHIVHINSLMGHKAIYVPTVNVYPASKFAVTALTETLRQELNAIGSKIKVTSISPGLVDTEIFEAASKSSGRDFDKDTKEFLKVAPILQPKDVADAICYVLSTPPNVQIHEMIIKPVGEMY